MRTRCITLHLHAALDLQFVDRVRIEADASAGIAELVAEIADFGGRGGDSQVPGKRANAVGAWSQSQDVGRESDGRVVPIARLVANRPTEAAVRLEVGHRHPS